MDFYELIAERYSVRKFKNEHLPKEIVDKMLGRSFEENFPKEICEIGEKALVIENLTERDGRVKDISMYVRRGEIVGLAGLVGGGKTELCKTLFGAYRKASGKIILNGKELNFKNPSEAVKNRIALVPEERRKEGVLVAETVTLASGMVKVLLETGITTPLDATICRPASWKPDAGVTFRVTVAPFT